MLNIDKNREEDVHDTFCWSRKRGAGSDHGPGQRFLREADVVIYAGSLVNPELLKETKTGCEILKQRLYDARRGDRRHGESGRSRKDDRASPQETRRSTERSGNRWTVLIRRRSPTMYARASAPSAGGVESPCGAHTPGRVPVRDHHTDGRADGCPGKENFRSWQPTMRRWRSFSTGSLAQMEKELAEAGYEPDTPAAIIYKATWPDEKIVRCTVSTLARSAEENGIRKTAMIFIGDVFGTRDHNGYEESRLYAPDFSTEFRKGTDQ